MSYLILLGCSPGNSKNIESASHSSFGDKNYSVIDSLLSRISNDTVALFNYLSLARSTHDRYAEMKTYHQLGMYYLDNYTFLKAIEYHTYYLETAEKEDNLVWKAEALNILAYDYQKICALDKSSELYFKALSLLNKSPENNNKKNQSEKAKTLNGLGNIYLKINQPDEAIFYLQKSLQIERQNNCISGQAKNLADIGSSFVNRMKYDSAHYYFNRSLELYTKINSISGMNFCYESLGNLYMIEGDYKNASVNIENAYESLLHTSDKLSWLHICFSIGDLYIKKGHYQDAALCLHEGLKVAEELELPGYLEKASLLLSELYKQQGNDLAALEAYTMGVSYAKAFRGEQNISRIMAHRLAYEKKSNEKEILLLRSQLKSIKRKKLKADSATLLVIITLTGFIIIFIQGYRLKKQKVEFSLHKEKIKSDFYINISDEFKMPVAIITELIERLRNNLNNNDIYKVLTDVDILSRQSQALGLLVDEMSSATKRQERRPIHNEPHSKDPKNNNRPGHLPAKENPAILIVENNKDIVYYISSILEGNCHILTADNGSEAVRKAAEIMPDIIISNIMVPGMNGYTRSIVGTGKSIGQDRIKNEASMEFLKQITDLIHKEINNTENIIDAISGRVGLSSSQLNRKIKAVTGMTTCNYILKVRLKKSGLLLARSQKPIGEIAMDCGFNDFAYFSRSFKKEFGMTPTSFQRLPHSTN